MNLDTIYSKIEIVGELPPNVKFDDQVFDLVDEFLQGYEESNYPLEILTLSKGVPAIKIACLLNICTWSTKDNGERQIIETRKWLYSDCEEKIRVALNLDYYPESDFNKFNIRLNEIERKFPNLKELCNYWMASIGDKLRLQEKEKGDNSILSKILSCFK